MSSPSTVQNLTTPLRAAVMQKNVSSSRRVSCPEIAPPEIAPIPETEEGAPWARPEIAPPKIEEGAPWARPEIAPPEIAPTPEIE